MYLRPRHILGAGLPAVAVVRSRGEGGTLVPMSKDAVRLVLVVEDDLSVRRPLVKFLEMHGLRW